MFKTVITLIRGASHDAEDGFKDANAHLLLQQYMRDASREVAAARRAVAVAIAQNQQEQAQHAKLLERIVDLEERTLAALDQNKSELAREAAQAIAYLEIERDTSEKAQSLFASEIVGLKRNVQAAESKLRELQQGQRLASAIHQTQKLRRTAPQNDLSSLNEAEDTLNRLRKRQTEIELTDRALAEMDASGNSETISEKLAAAGCGRPLATDAEQVLERLKGKSKKPSKSKNTTA